MKRGYAEVPEGQMHYRMEGEGEPVILLHMAVASGDEFVRPIHYISKYYCAIALDFLSAGDSDPAPYPLFHRRSREVGNQLYGLDGD